jgi:hypothetical protein
VNIGFRTWVTLPPPEPVQRYLAVLAVQARSLAVLAPSGRLIGAGVRRCAGVEPGLGPT